MKSAAFFLVLTHAVTALSAPLGLICREDFRLDNGHLRELILSPVDGGVYSLQSHFISSRSSTEIEIDSWAEKLTCRIDEKSMVAFCNNQQGLTVQIKDRREAFLDSLEEDAKKKTNRFIDFSLDENGVVNKASSFAASYCQTFGG